jgi:hypothetical protein
VDFSQAVVDETHLSSSVPIECESGLQSGRHAKAEDRPTERPTESFALSIDTNAVTQEAKATEEATVGLKQHGRVD